MILMISPTIDVLSQLLVKFIALERPDERFRLYVYGWMFRSLHKMSSLIQNINRTFIFQIYCRKCFQNAGIFY